jgi:hypothetical protein
MSLSQNYPTTRPTLTLDFAKAKRVDPRVTFTRASTATYFDASGTLRSAAANAPRIDFDPATLACRGLLVEEQRTNLVLYSSDLTNAAWVVSNITAAKNQVGIDGQSNSASSITASAANGTVLQSITSASAARASSAYVKRITGTGVIEMTQDNGATWTAVTVTSAWTRVSIPSATITNPVVGFRIVTNGDAIAVDGVQLENGAFPTSYIPTTTTSLTRSADVASVTTLSPWYNATEGTIYAEATFTTAATVQGETSITNFLNGTSTDNQLRLNRNASGETVRLRYRTAASDIAAISTNTIFGTNKIAAAFTNGSQAICADGNAPATATGVGAMPSVDNLVLGRFSTSSTGTILNGYLRRITYYNTRLPNAQLQALTAP